MNGILAFFCVILFSLTVPATRIAAQVFDPGLVALFRLVGAALICGVVIVRWDRWAPPVRIWKSLGIVSFGSVWGFSILIALAMNRVPATHGAIGLAALPLFTAAYSAIRDRKNPGMRFWVFCVLGTLLGLSYFGLRAGHFEFGWGDLFLFFSVLCSALGYVEGGRLSREYGGRRIMSWAVVLALPFAMILLIPRLSQAHVPLPGEAAEAWLAVGYLALVSQSLGMFLWFRVLAVGPMVRVALIQLFQPFLSITASAVLLHESVSMVTWGVALLVAGCVFGANRQVSAIPE